MDEKQYLAFTNKQSQQVQKLFDLINDDRESLAKMNSIHMGVYSKLEKIVSPLLREKHELDSNVLDALEEILVAMTETSLEIYKVEVSRRTALKKLENFMKDYKKTSEEILQTAGKNMEVC